MLNSQVQKTIYGLMDMIYPVGSYYITESSELNTAAKMAIKFGGTWVKVSNKFLYGTSSDSGAGTEGGSNNAKVISHSHTFSGDNASGTFDSFPPPQNGWPGHTGVFTNVGNTGNYTYTGTNANTRSLTRFTFSMTPSGTISTEGESATNANMPAYRTVYIYRRTALAEGG